RHMGTFSLMHPLRYCRRQMEVSRSPLCEKHLIGIVMHETDVFYLYPDFIPDLKLDPAAELLRHQMMDYWVSFAVSLDPNDGKGIDRNVDIFLIVVTHFFTFRT